MAPTIVIQTKRGIGDVIWHLPFIRGIAAASPGGKVTFLSLASSHAQELLQAEPCIDAIFYFENRGSELARGLHLVRLIALLRRLGGDTAWILDRSVRPAIATLVAGYSHRIGLGFGRQRWFITNPGIDLKFYHAHPIAWLSALMQAMKVPLPTTEPNLHLPRALVAAVGERYGSLPRPWIVLAFGSSDPDKDWTVEKWLAFITNLRRSTQGTVFLIGGPQNEARAAHLIERTAGAGAVEACDLTVIEAACLLRQAQLFVGPDSGPLNLAAAVGTPAFGLFGASRVLTYSRFIHAVLPDDGRAPTPDGVQRTSPERVLTLIAQYL
jgi:heptosyltransferase-2